VAPSTDGEARIRVAFPLLCKKPKRQHMASFILITMVSRSSRPGRSSDRRAGLPSRGTYTGAIGLGTRAEACIP